MDKYLAETSCIDFSAPVIQERVKKLRQESDSTLDYIEKAYLSQSEKTLTSIGDE